jgi:hypothetical protein
MSEKEPTPPLLTLGAEFEMALIYRIFQEGEDTSETLLGKEGYPHEVKIELSLEDLPAHKKLAYEYCTEVVTDALKEAGLDDKVNIKVSEQDYTLELNRLEEFHSWVAKDDISISAGYVRDIDPRLEAFQLEINTPMFHDSSEAYDMIRFTVNVIASKFAVTINPSCGFHVHVGNCASWYSHEEIRRIGSLCWAASNLLSCLHSPIRLINPYAQPLRTCSVMGFMGEEYQKMLIEHNNSKTDQSKLMCHRYLANMVRFGERPLLWRETHKEPSTLDAFAETRVPGVSEPFIDDDAPLTITEMPAWDRQIVGSQEPALLPQNTPTSYEYEYPKRIEGGLKHPIEWDQKPNWTDPPFEGKMKPQKSIAQRIARLEPPGVVPPPPSRLSKIPRFKRPFLDQDDIDRLHGIMVEEYGAADWDPNPQLEEDSWGVWGGVNRIYQAKSTCEVAFLLNADLRLTFSIGSHASCGYMSDMKKGMWEKKTLEWRQADGSMDARWVYTYLRIVVGTVRFAIQASATDFLNVIANCEKFEEGGSYDVVDFLEEIGLVAESKVASRRLHQLRAEWGREYESQDGPADGQPKRSAGDDDNDEDAGPSKRGRIDNED